MNDVASDFPVAGIATAAMRAAARGRGCRRLVASSLRAPSERPPCLPVPARDDMAEARGDASYARCVFRRLRLWRGSV